MSDVLKNSMAEAKQKWLALEPTKRRIIIAVTAIILMVAFAMYLGGKREAQSMAAREASTPENVQQTSMVAPKTGEVGIDDLKGLTQAEIERQRKQQEALIQNQQQISNDYRSGNEAVAQQVTDLSRQLASVTDEVKSIRLGNGNGVGGVTLPPLQGLDSNIGAVPTDLQLQQGNQPVAPMPLNDAPQPSATPDEMISPRQADTSVDPFQIIRSGKQAKDFQSNGYRPANQAGTAKNLSVQAEILLKKGLPTGSMLSGVLLNGMDAPTGGKGTTSAVPALIRIKANAVLPNRYTQAVKECFVLVSGVGNLATERADMRGEKISCIFKDGTSIDAPIAAYVVGEDGKGGMRGRVVTKQGAVIARSIFAGTIAGLGKQLTPSNVPALDISGGANTQYQTPDFGKASQIAAASGVGSALERVANFYMDMAEQMVSVIEVDAGRNVTIILTNTMKGVKN